jgi:hypothetical protein
MLCRKLQVSAWAYAIQAHELMSAEGFSWNGHTVNIEALINECYNSAQVVDLR